MKKHALLLATGTLLSLGLYAQDAGSRKAAAAKPQKESSGSMQSSSNVSAADGQKNKQAQQPLQRDQKQPATSSDPAATRKQKQ